MSLYKSKLNLQFVDWNRSTREGLCVDNQRETKVQIKMGHASFLRSEERFVSHELRLLVHYCESQVYKRLRTENRQGSQQ